MAANLTALVPSSSDLLLAFPRLGSHIAGMFGLAWDPLGVFAADTNVSTILSPATITERTFTQSTSGLPGAAAVPDSGFVDSVEHILQRLASFDGVFSYVASRWAFSTLILSIVLNRAHVYASSREHIDLSWKARLFLRLAPLALLCFQTFRILQTVRCQTGFQLPEIRFKDSDNVINRSWVEEQRGIYSLLSKVLFWEEVQDSCRAVQMIPGDSGGPTAWYGSTTILWPLFITLSFSQFVETMSSALQGRMPRPETGMTMFEHSMAFAEAETVTRTAVGLGLFGLPTSSSSPTNADRVSPDSEASHFTFTRSMLLSRLNVPPEVLLISLISACSHIANHVLGIMGLQTRFRLANTTTWGMLYLTLFIYSFANYARPSNADEMQKIRYPTVCIIGYLPHLLIAVGMLLCSLIYTAAIISTLLSSPTHWQRLSFLERLRLAHSNMSVSVSLSNIRVRATEDFYTVLLKAGYYMMSAATEAVYFNEGAQVTLSSSTWVDKARSRANQATRGRLTQTPLELQEGFAGGEGFGLTDEDAQAGPDGSLLLSGYAVERKTMKKLNKTSLSAMKEEGVGISQRSGRWIISWKLIEQIFTLVVYCMARFALHMMESLGGYAPPNWMLRLARIPGRSSSAADSSPRDRPLDFWTLSGSGHSAPPSDPNVDVEAEARKRLALDPNSDEATLDSQLYSWWKSGGWWGDLDSSGDYTPHAATGGEDDDAASIISESSAWESASSECSGTQTPTQADYADYGTSSALDADDDATPHLARLLDPKNLADKQEARMLAHRLRRPTSPGPMTRAQYRRSLLRDQPRSFLSAATPGNDPNGVLSAADEELVLSSLISSRRKDRGDSAAAGPSEAKHNLAWEQGGDGMGSSGPQCAICHSAPRTVLVWPCRCLSLCEECRMSLAVNNFGSCVCCRRDVVAFSRLFVP